MFVAFCPLHGCDVLLGPRRLRSLVTLASGVLAVKLQCYDGTTLLVLTGTQVTSQLPPPQSAAR